MRIIEDIKYGLEAEHVLDLYIADVAAAPVFIYLHGGGLEGGTHKYDTQTGMIRMLADKGVTVISADYRKYPQAKYPQFIEDGAEVVSWVINNIGSYTDYSNIFVGGSSAGGYITQMLCFNKQYLLKKGVNESDISGYFHDAGQPTTHFNVLRERGVDEAQTVGRVVVDEAAPMYYIEGNQEYLPMQFVVSDNDMPNRYEQTALMMAMLRNFGYDMDKIGLTVMENTEHCSYNEEIDADGENHFVNEIFKFIKKYTK